LRNAWEPTGQIETEEPTYQNPESPKEPVIDVEQEHTGDFLNVNEVKLRAFVRHVKAKRPMSLESVQNHTPNLGSKVKAKPHKRFNSSF